MYLHELLRRNISIVSVSRRLLVGNLSHKTVHLRVEALGVNFFSLPSYFLEESRLLHKIYSCKAIAQNK